MISPEARSFDRILTEGVEASLRQLGVASPMRLAQLRSYAGAIGESLFYHVFAGALTGQELMCAMMGATRYVREKIRVAEREIAKIKASEDKAIQEAGGGDRPVGEAVEGVGVREPGEGVLRQCPVPNGPPPDNSAGDGEVRRDGGKQRRAGNSDVGGRREVRRRRVPKVQRPKVSGKETK
jgi:hypothetical protein